MLYWSDAGQLTRQIYRDWWSGPVVPTKDPGHSLALLCQKCRRPLHNQPATTHPSLRPVVSLSLGILHERMRTQMLAKPPSNLLQRTGGDHRGGRAQLGWRTFMMTRLRWILGYMRLEIWRKIDLSGGWCFRKALRTRSGACYYWILVRDRWSRFQCILRLHSLTRIRVDTGATVVC